MKLFPKLALVLSGVALAPLAVLAVFGLSRSDQALRARIEGEQERLATHAAALASSRVRDVLRGLTLQVTVADLATASEDVLRGVLRIAYRQSDAVTIVSLIDERGEPLTESVYLEDPSSSETLRRHEPISDEDLAEHGRRIPLDAALASGAAIGPPYGRPGHPRVAVAAVAPTPREGRRVLLVAEVSLSPLAEDLAALARDDEEVLLLGPSGTALSAPDEPVALPGGSHDELPDEPVVGVYREGRTRRLGAFAPVPVLGWGVLVRQDEALALEPTARLRRQGLYWGIVGLATALLLAFLVARDLSGRIRELDVQAGAIARGELGGRVAVRSTDELGRLSEAFNRMAGDLGAQRDEIQRQNDEIRKWNEELEARVEEKSAELARAQEVVLRSRRLAGLGVLGAGVAHEINNPLASALGFIQLVKLDRTVGEKHRSSLDEAERAALRIRTIVQDLLKLADSQSRPLRAALDPNEVVRRALAMVEGTIDSSTVTLELALAEGLPKVEGDQEQLTEVVLHLVRNALNALGGPGALRVATAQAGRQAVTLTVEDTGRGIPSDLLDRIFDPFFTTKEYWEGRGLGLSIVHKIVEDHLGRLDITSEVGQGTTVVVTLPVAAGGRHLR